MEDKNVEIIKINGIEYAIVEEIDEYVYAINPENHEDIKILSTKEDKKNLKVLEGLEESVALDRFYEQYSYLNK